MLPLSGRYGYSGETLMGPGCPMTLHGQARRVGEQPAARLLGGAQAHMPVTRAAVEPGTVLQVTCARSS